MDLSICMMVKDEAENLEGCLKSLVPLMEQIKSELIIVDTGSTDNTVEIASRYTEKVYFHEWNNDFSEMRNITINYAKGKWIFIIDADEKVENVDEIVVFLKSKYKTQYKSCLLSVKNITNFETNDYVMLTSPRIFINDGTFCYKGKVHNEPQYKSPTLTLNTILIHSGYNSSNKELMEKKFNRTSNLLKQEIEKEPRSIYYNYQLSVTYGMHGDKGDALEQIKKAYEILINSNEDRKTHLYVYYQLVNCYLLFENDLENLKKAETICREGIKIEKDYIDLYLFLAKIQLLTGRYDEAEKNYIEFLKLAEQFEGLSIRHNASLQIYSLCRVPEAHYDLMYLYNKTRNYNKVIEIIGNLMDKNHLNNSIEIIINSYIKLEKYKELYNFYKEKLYELDADILKRFYEILEINLNNIKKEKAKLLVEIFSKDQDTYSFLNKIRSYYGQNYEGLGSIINGFVNNIDLNSQPNYFGDIIYFKMNMKESIYEILSNVMPSKIEEFIVYMAKKYEDFSELVCSYLIDNRAQDFSMIRINKMLARFILVMNKLDNKQYYDIFNEYVECGTNYVRYVYSDKVIDNIMIFDVKSEEDSFFIFMYHAYNAKNDDEKEYIRYLKKALLVYPFMKKGIEILKDEINNNLDKEIKEFEQYKLQIKNTIKNLIINNELDNAKKLINEYEKIVNNDIEIVLFKSEIKIKELNINCSEN